MTSSLTEQELDAVSKLIDLLEGLGCLAALPSTEALFAVQVLQKKLDAAGAFATLSAQLVGLIAAADPAVALVSLERKTAALFVDSLLAVLWKLDYPCAGRLKPSAAQALSAAPARMAVPLCFRSNNNMFNTY